MKRSYEEPELELIRLREADIITESELEYELDPNETEVLELP